MYLPKHFAETDVGRLDALMRANPLATVVTGGGGLDANHLALLPASGAPDGQHLLHRHVARGNPLALLANDCGGSPSFFVSQQLEKGLRSCDLAQVMAVLRDPFDDEAPYDKTKCWFRP